MRPSTAVLVAALAVLLVIPSSLSRPQSVCSKARSVEAASSSAAESSSSEDELKVATANGVYEKKSKEDASKAVSANAVKSSESLVSVDAATGVAVKAKSSGSSVSTSSASSSSSSSSEVFVAGGGCGCGSKSVSRAIKELTEADIKVIYAQKEGESLEAYFKRIVAKTEYTSTIESYIKILTWVRKDFATLDLWYDIKYLSLVKEYYSAVYTKLSSESEEVYYSRILTKEAWESDELFAKRVIVVRDLFPTLALWTEEKYFEKYTKVIYSTYYKKLATETEEAYISRIFAKDSFFDTSDEIWAKRIFLIQEATLSNSIWYEEKYFSYIKSFYTVYYTKVVKETNDVWLTRVLKPFPGESLDLAIKRVRLIKKATESCGFWKFDLFTKVKSIKCFQSDYLSLLQKDIFVITESDVKTIYVQQKDESIESYFKRIVSKADFITSTELYVKTLNWVRKDFATLDLWYDIKYIDLVKEYYTTIYAKTATETEEVYYSRILKKETWETEELYAKRVIVVRDLFPSLSLWTEEKYFEKYTKVIYSTYYKKLATETEEAYISRIFAKDSFFDTSDEIWAKRIFLIQEATLSNSIWYEEKYFSYIKSFYSVYYTTVLKETNDVWLTRVLKPFPGESLDLTIKRVRLIKKATSSCGFWKFSLFRKIYSTNCFESKYVSLLQREIFEITESDIKEIYVQQKGESLESYFKRIVSKADFITSTEYYIKVLNWVRKDFATLDLWYDIKYIDLVKEYYTTIYAKTATEAEEVYYSRILKKEAWETEELYAKRVIVVRDLFPTLALWTEEKYFEKYTKVIYSTYYKKLATETEEAYISRIFAKDSFFDTSDEIWAKRIFLIQEATLSSSIWYEEKYFSYIKSFYSVYYTTVLKETNDVWLTRVLKPFPGESLDLTIKRVQLIKKATSSCGFWKFSLFRKIYSTNCFESKYVSLLQREIFEITESDIKEIYVQQKGESLESYFKRIVSKADFITSTEYYIKILNWVRKDFATLDLWYDIKYIDLVKEYYTTIYAKTATEAEEVYYSRILKKEAWETEELYAKRVIVVRDLFPTLALWTEEKYFEKYTKVIYSTYYKKLTTETEEAYISRIFAKDSFFDTSDEIWAKRIFLIQEATLSSSIWYEEKYFSYIKSFYSVYYTTVLKETNDVWLTRVLKPFPGESLEFTIKRIGLIKKATSSCGFWKFSLFRKIYSTKCFESKYVSLLQKEIFEITESDIKEIYVQQKGESLDSYFKRIVAKADFITSTELYIKVLNWVRKDFATLDLWYDIKYIDLVKEYYSALYVKKSCETEEAYYSRLIVKEAWESDVQYAKRIILVRDLFPTLPLWTADTYFAKYTKSLYSIVYKRWENECEEAYIKRIFTKDSFFDTSDEIWARRLFFIQRATISSSIWYDAKYFSYFQGYYSVFYKKLEKESSVAWLTRILTPLEGESFELAIKRIHFIKKVLGSCGCWSVETYKLIKATKCFQPAYYCLLEKEFFPLTQVVIKSNKKSKTFESSSSSQSASAEALKVNTATGQFEKTASASQAAASKASGSESEESLFVSRKV